ncbi:oxidoreductase [Lactobacillus selangorensis]|uniref:Oxidoreductase n=1 Tax=Lactobacillus selangorensis TaxID=81857 RepID=A0A0R2FIR6_9LACO|nr:SDR family oxidoreductase [Lactobacillus selangorensis]KRN28158.1 oxidoreductase [Lactobacillus selangorensis]KRN30966.1 oxidoreductase [Lactobacillus selangorensis]
MKNVLILGAHGQIAQLATQMMLKEDLHLTLFLRNASRITVTDPQKETVVDGDVTDLELLKKTMQGQDVVYANLAGGNIKAQAQAVVTAMDAENINRLIWISTLGIYDEVPGKFGQWNNATLGSYLTTYRSAADVIEGSDLDYTIIRPAWLTNNDEVVYEVTQKGEPFKGTEVSRKSIAAVVTDITLHPEKYAKASIGVDKPGTGGDKPAWY